MTLNDFEGQVDAKIVERGFDYFEEDNVDNLEKVASGFWLAHVYGSDTYTVEVRTHRTRIKSWDCDCPYDHGPVCKHVVAVFYAIHEELESMKTVPKKTDRKKKTATRDKVAEILGKIDKKELERFIISGFKEYPGLKNAFIAHFVDLLEDDLDQKYRTLVRNVYKSAKGRYGFIDYRNTRKLTGPLHQLIQKAEDLLTDKNYMEALAIAKVLIEEIPVFIHNMDDSDGSAGFLIDTAFEILYRIGEEAPPMLKDDLFVYCLAEYPKEKYHDFGFEGNFLNMMPLLVTLKEQEEKFFTLLDVQIEMARNEEYSKYRMVELIKYKLDYLQRAKRYDEANALIVANKEYSDFREMLVDTAISKKEFEKARILCEEGVKIAQENDYYGDELNWFDKQLLIAEKEKDTAAIRKWTQKLYFAHGHDMEYYKKLKQTYDKDTWPSVYEALIGKIVGPDKRGAYGIILALANIYVEEQEWSRLLKQIQISTHSISILEAYSPYLQDRYPDEILDSYTVAVKNTAKDTGRKVYNEVARYLKKMEEIKGGKEEVGKLLGYFRENYKNRRAMMEILDKKFHDRDF